MGEKGSHIVIGWNLALTKGSGWYRKRSLTVSINWGEGGGWYRIMHLSRENVQWQNSGNKPQHRVEERAENEI